MKHWTHPTHGFASRGRLLLACMLFAAVASFGNAGLEDLNRIYEQALSRIHAEHARTFQERGDHYRAELRRLQQRLQHEGELQAVLAVGTEEDRFRKTRTPPETPGPDTPARLARLQETFIEEINQATLEKNEVIVALTEKYMNRLEALQREQTRRGNFDAALDVHQEIERVRKNPAFTAAQFALADLEQTEKTEAQPARTGPRCPHCNGSGEAEIDCRHCNGTGECRRCNGTGQRPSGFRGGRGSVGCVTCRQTGECRHCDGTGKVMGDCPVCDGRGVVAYESE